MIKKTISRYCPFKTIRNCKDEGKRLAVLCARRTRSLELLIRRRAYLTVLFAWKVALSTTEKSKKGGGVCSKLAENAKLIHLHMRTKR
jgi:hypothetical protein